MAVLPALAAAVAAVFAADLLRRGRAGAAPVWGLALMQFAIASAALAWGVAAGWTPAVFRTYYLFGAILNVPWLALGTVRLLASRSIAGAAAVLVLIGTAYASVLGAALPLQEGYGAAISVAGIPAAGEVAPPELRTLSRWYSIVGSLVVLGGLGWSLRGGGRRASGLGLLVVGIVIVAGASVSARRGVVAPFSVALALGVTVMYAGFRRTVRPRPEGSATAR